MKRPENVPDPAFSDTDLDRAVVEAVGRIGGEGIAHSPSSMPQHYGPIGEPEDHNSGWLWNAYSEP